MNAGQRQPSPSERPRARGTGNHESEPATAGSTAHQETVDRSASAGNRRRPGLILFAVLLCAAGTGIAAWRWIGPCRLAPDGSQADALFFSREEPRLRQLCTHCHLFAQPEVLPRSSWAETVWKMSRLPGYGSNMGGKIDTAAVARWFQERAPERLHLPTVETAQGRGALSMTKHEITWAEADSNPFVSHVQMVDLLGDARPELLICDMRNGTILMGRLEGPQWSLTPVAEVANPAHVEVIDLDADGRRDLIVANLGSFTAIDHTLGSVEWFRGSADGGFERTTLAEHLGRVADVQPADLDADGDLDLVVGEFGYQATGHLLVLENRARAGEPPAFVSHEIDGWHGASHVPPADLNGDGLPDIVVLYSQGHEMVRCYLNRGGLRFERRDLHRAPHPAWGYSGLQLVDLDSDGDQDILLTNGDTFDEGLLKPYHGISWVENQGPGVLGPASRERERPEPPVGSPPALRFELHDLVRMYGVYRAEAADIDGDGDRDIVACALAESNEQFSPGEEPRLESILWLEQTDRGRFVHRSFEASQCHHPTLTLGDFDLDGDIDLLVGNGRFDDSGSSGPTACVDVWENQSQ